MRDLIAITLRAGRPRRDRGSRSWGRCIGRKGAS